MKILGNKTSRDNFVDKSLKNEEVNNINKDIGTINNKDLFPPTKKINKSIEKIKEETISEYNNLTLIEKNDNNKLLPLVKKFDILEELNFNILKNDLNYVKNKNDNNYSLDSFIEHYKNFRHTLSTEKRIDLLNEYNNMIKNNKKEINLDYEKQDPRILIKNLLLNFIELSQNKNLKPLEFYQLFNKLLDDEYYDLTEKFYVPANFGNLNYKYSLLFSDYLKNFRTILYKKNNNGQMERDNNHGNIRSKFEKKMKIIIIFSETIKNNGSVLKNDIYYRYLKNIHVILSLCDNKKISYFIISIISEINNCMINLITKDDLKQFIHKNPSLLFLKKDNKEIELNDEIINHLLLNEILICKNGNGKLDFKINKYNANVLKNLKVKLIGKNWIDCNFEFIEEYNFINKNENLKNEFMIHIKKIMQSPYVKNIYKDIENRFDTNDYIYDSEEILNEVFQYIHFFPFPFEDIFGFADKGTLDIFICMYDDNCLDLFDMLGKLYANCNDIIHELFHISPVYYINNSDNKKFSDYYSNVPSKKKKEYIQTQSNFLKEIKSLDLNIKKENDIDLGDSIEIELYGFCLRKFNLYNTLNLFIEDTWYKEEKIKKFRENIIKGSKLNEDDTNEIIINIEEYKNSSNILKTFFQVFQSEENEIISITKNKLIFARKREFTNEDESKYFIFSRPLGLSRYQIYPGPGEGFRP